MVLLGPSEFWRIVVNIYEPTVGFSYPVVQHVFNGRTEAEAVGYYKAHMKTDAFMRDCLEHSGWENVQCIPYVFVVPPGFTLER